MGYLIAYHPVNGKKNTPNVWSCAFSFFFWVVLQAGSIYTIQSGVVYFADWLKKKVNPSNQKLLEVPSFEKKYIHDIGDWLPNFNLKLGISFPD